MYTGEMVVRKVDIVDAHYEAYSIAKKTDIRHIITKMVSFIKGEIQVLETLKEENLTRDQRRSSKGCVNEV